MADILDQKVTEFLDSNIVEDYLPYNKDTTYTYEETPSNISACEHKGFYWQVTVDSSTGNEPSDTDPNWAKVSPSKLTCILDESAFTFAESNEDEDLWFTIQKNYNISALILGRFSARTVIIEYLDINDNVLDTDTIEYSIYPLDVEPNEWNHGNTWFEDVVNKSAKIDLKIIGEKVKITLVRNPESRKANIAFFIGGSFETLGTTMSGVDETSDDYTPSTNDAPVVSRTRLPFVTQIPRIRRERYITKAKDLKTRVTAYIINPKGGDIGELIVLAKLENYSCPITTFNKLKFNWNILEAIGDEE